MRIGYTIGTALEGIRTNKVRSALTTLGIVIGITAIILIVSLGKGAEQLILDQIQGMGGDVIAARPGKQPTGLTDITDTLFSDSLTKKDVDALKKKGNVPDLVAIAPAMIVSGNVTYRGESYRPTMFGWDADFTSEMLNVYPEVGVNFDEDDIRQKASVVIIGSKVKDELFGEEEAVGKNVKIKNRNFRVLGVYPEFGQSLFFNVDDLVLMPYTTAQTYMLGVNHYHEVIMRVGSAANIDRAVADVERTIRERHNIDDPDNDDFFVESQQAAADQISVILSSFTMFLSAVVAISLVVGGIGVMNIMLVSVTERTREIGLRKALGATNSNIMFQFILEAVMLTMSGGIIGIILGSTFSILAAIGLSEYMNTDWNVSFPMSAAILGVFVSSAVGVVFGSYPAYKASKKSPIEALRYE
jgi:putative ABC transport system permease protein